MQGIATGSIHKSIELRTSKNGNQFATFTVRENVNGATRWWQCICFSESAIDELRQLEPGSPISIAGGVDAEIYAPQGSNGRINWRCTVDAVLTPKAKRRLNEDAPRDAAPADGAAHARRSWAAPQTGGGAAALDEDIPFGPEWR